MTAEAPQPLIEAQGLSASRLDGTCLQDLSFAVPPGAVVAVISEPLASGRLLMDCICGAAQATAGSVTVCGKAPADLSAADRQKLTTLRGPAAFPDSVTVRELLEQLSLLLGDTKPLSDVLTEFGVDNVADIGLRDLNAESQQLVRLACATVGTPSVLLAEKLDDNLSPVKRRAAYRFIKDLRDTGGAVLFTTDNMETTEAVCNRVLVLREGKLVAYDTPENLILAKDNWMRVEVFTDSELELPKISDLDYVHRVVGHGNRCDIFVNNEFDSVRKVIGFLDSENIDIRDLRTYRSTLSDVVWELL